MTTQDDDGDAPVERFDADRWIAGAAALGGEGDLRMGIKSEGRGLGTAGDGEGASASRGDDEGAGASASASASTGDGGGASADGGARPGDGDGATMGEAGDEGEELPEYVLRPRAARMTPDQLIGRALLRLRLYIGWSQRDLEAASGVDQSTICRLETGHGANVGSRRLNALLTALRVDDVIFQPRPPAAPPTALELMLRGDPWKRAAAEADRRISRRRSA